MVGVEVFVDLLADELGLKKLPGAGKVPGILAHRDLGPINIHLGGGALDLQIAIINDEEDGIAKSRVVAPASGTILSIPVIAGEVVVAAARGRGTTLCTLADLSALLVEAHVNQLDIGKVTKGSIVEVLSGTDQANPTPAQLNFIAPLATIKNKVKGFAIEAVLEGETSKFRPGMTVGLRLPLATATNAVSVPVGSVFDSRSGKIVYLQQGDGDVEKRSVDVGATDLFYAEIREGLKEGDRILIAKPDDGNS